MSAPLQWTRPAQFLVYLVPVGDIPLDLFASYVQLLKTYHILPLRSLTRPGGYAAELSPFRGLDWAGPGALRFHFVSTAERIETFNGEDVHASNRVIGALGVCHSPSLPLTRGLRAAHTEFTASVRHLKGLLMHKLFAFEHTFEDVTAKECKGLDDLVMIPVHHELPGTGESTVSLHLQVVMDTLAVNILMSLESAIRSTTSITALNDLTLSAMREDLASVLLDVDVEPQLTNGVQQSGSLPLVLSRDARVDATFDSALSPTTRLSGSSLSSIPSPLANSVAASDRRNRRRKKQLARREKLLGDYNVLVSCISGAMDHYTVAIEMLREEERRSGGASADALWLAAALEGYVFCLYTESQDKFLTELVEKASEAVAFYAKAGTSELESLFIENLGSYYARVAMATSACTSMTGKAKFLESIWTKRLLWDVLERGMTMFPELHPQRQIQFLIETSRTLETVGHRRRAALFLHEAASLLLNRNPPFVDAQTRSQLSPTGVIRGSQRQRDLKAALILERVAADQLGISTQSTRKGEFLPWGVTTQHHRNQRKKSSGTYAPTVTPDNAWLIIRFHVLRQLLTIARMLGDARLVGTYCLQLLEMLVWCDSIAVPPMVDPPHTCLSPSWKKTPASHTTSEVDGLQRPATLLRVTRLPVERIAAGLHAKGGIYFFPPPGIDTKVKRNFINSPSTAMSNAAASLSSTLTNTPRMLATPRQQFSAAVNAISTKASPAFTPFSNAHHQHNGSMAGRPGGVDDYTATNIVEQKKVGSAGVIGEEEYKRVRLLGAGDGELDGTLRLTNAIAEPDSVWDLRSKTEIAKIEEKLLHTLESDCTALQYNEQLQLPTFLRVDKLELRSSCTWQDPLLSRVTALQMFGVQSASSQQAVESDFFYAPFEQQKMRKTGKRGSNGKEEDSDDTPAMYERSFPVTERIELQLTLSNPTSVMVKVQEVKAWITFLEEDDGVTEKDGNTNPTIGIECYPCIFTLEPYQKRKSVVLSMQPLRVGTFHVRGCFIKAFNIKTFFELDNPVNICVVAELPRVSLSLREHSSMTLLSDEKEVVAAKAQLAMFLSETRQCTVSIRITGNRQITNYRLAVTVQHRREIAKHTYVVFNNLPPASATTEDGSVQISRSSTNDMSADESGMIDTPFLSLKCGKVVSSSLPLTSGDFVSIPFEVSLRGTHKSVEDDIWIEWCFVYADETPLSPNDIGDSADAIFYRESKLALEVVLLPSLMLESVMLLPCSAVQIPTSYRPPEDETGAACGIGNSAQVVRTDYLYCVIMVHIVNPTETLFRFRLRHNTDTSGDVMCEEEIDRRCSRRFVVEVPRFQILTLDQGSSNLADLLNDLVKMEWETYFGIQGRLLCEDHNVGSFADHGQAKLELFLPPIRFQIESPYKERAVAGVGSKQHGDMDVSNSRRGRSISLRTLSFFELSHLRVKSQRLQIALFEYIPIAIAVQRVDNNDHALFVEVEVIITDEGEKAVCKLSDHVMVVGKLKAHVRWDDKMDRSTQRHEIQCMFLSEGNFRVAVCGRILSPDMKQVDGEIWSHQSIHVCVRSKYAFVAEKSATTIEYACKLECH
ncbi:unnamed protein product [Peronospora destructor]|uniref:Trs120/TRAPPC9 N-terminal domain-containing protein n=1 Tax=Peronospora destructor TaxID=86335 RepID=A0AAV0VE36_9STRA|nr:unnamed protein product [Peronospora destructor]